MAITHDSIREPLVPEQFTKKELDRFKGWNEGPNQIVATFAINIEIVFSKTGAIRFRYRYRQLAAGRSKQILIDLGEYCKRTHGFLDGIRKEAERFNAMRKANKDPKTEIMREQLQADTGYRFGEVFTKWFNFEHDGNTGKSQRWILFAIQKDCMGLTPAWTAKQVQERKAKGLSITTPPACSDTNMVLNPKVNTATLLGYRDPMGITEMEWTAFLKNHYAETPHKLKKILSTLKRFYREYRLARSISDRSPMADITMDLLEVKTVVQKPLQYLKPERQSRILWAASQLSNKQYEDVIELMFLLGCRPSEIRTMELIDFYLDLRLWVLPAHKTEGAFNRPIIRPLSNRVIEILEPYFEAASSNKEKLPYTPLFPSKTGASTPYIDEKIFDRAKASVDKLLTAELGDVRYSPDWVTYDTRRTVREDIGMVYSYHDCEVVLGHYSHVPKQAQAYAKELRLKEQAEIFAWRAAFVEHLKSIKDPLCKIGGKKIVNHSEIKPDPEDPILQIDWADCFAEVDEFMVKHYKAVKAYNEYMPSNKAARRAKNRTKFRKALNAA